MADNSNLHYAWKGGKPSFSYISHSHWHRSSQAPGTVGRQMLFLTKHWENLLQLLIPGIHHIPVGQAPGGRGTDLRCQAQEIGFTEAPALPCEGPRRARVPNYRWQS